MASLAEHLSAPPVALPSLVPTAAQPSLAEIGFFCLSVSLLAFSCAALASSSMMVTRR